MSGVTAHLQILLVFVPPNVTVGSGGAASGRVQRTPVSVFLPALLSFDDKARADDSKPFLFPKRGRQRAFEQTRVHGPPQPSGPPVAKGTATVLVGMEIAHPPPNSSPSTTSVELNSLTGRLSKREGWRKKEKKTDKMREGLSYGGRKRGGGDGRVLLLFLLLS